MANDYEVGYGKPPKETRFKPGRSGNPKGRPKGRRNLITDLYDILREYMTVREGGRELRLTKQQAMLRSLWLRAIKGDTRASAELVKLVERHEADQESGTTFRPLSQDDHDLLEDYVQRAAGPVNTLEERYDDA